MNAQDIFKNAVVANPNPWWVREGMQQTKQFENFRPNIYYDTEDIPTVGYGYNLNAHPHLPKKMTREYADEIFPDIYLPAVNLAREYSGPAWLNMTEQQKIILSDMAYNLYNKLYGFEHMQKALHAGDHEGVKREMKRSKWYHQVGNRSKSHIANWNAEDKSPQHKPLSSFGQAFKEARQAGLDEFTFKGKRYSTKQK